MLHRALSIHKEHELLQKLEAAGLDDGLAQSVIESPDSRLAKQVVAFIRRGGCLEPTSLNQAREIMGSNMLATLEVMHSFHINPSAEQTNNLRVIPYNEITLYDCRESHLLIAGYPFSIADIFSKVPPGTFEGGELWWCNKRFAKEERVHSRWYLIRKDCVPGSILKSPYQQSLLLKANEEIPRACELLYAVVIHFLVNKIWLFPDNYARTATRGLDKYDYIAVGCSKDGDIDIWTTGAGAEGGLASMKRFD